MSKVNTVLGPIPTEKLGPTLIHEHLVCGHPGQEYEAAMPYDRDAIVAACTESLKEAEAHGVETIVDVTPIDLGRDAELQRQVSAKSGINIVCATGLYMDIEGDADSSRTRSPTLDTSTGIYETFMKEINQGIEATGIKAGVIKVATGHGRISAREEMVLKAGARAQKETGVPIITHTEGGTMGPEQADLLISEGADPRRIMIGHIGGNTDPEYHTSVLERGVYIAFDRLGLDILVSDSQRIACIVRLLETGYADRIMLSHDYVRCFLGQEPEPAGSLEAVLPNWSYTHVFRNIIPALKEAGATDETIHTLIVENPRRLFSGE